MGLETRGMSGPYLYRKVREGRRVRSVYVGSGLLARGLAALEAEKRSEEHRRTPTEGPETASFVAEVEAYCEGVGRIVRAHLEASGYRRHKRGEWRRRRDGR